MYVAPPYTTAELNEAVMWRTRNEINPQSQMAKLSLETLQKILAFLLTEKGVKILIQEEPAFELYFEETIAEWRNVHQQ